MIPRNKLQPRRERLIHHRSVQAVAQRQFCLDGQALLQIEGAKDRIGIADRLQLNQSAPVHVCLAGHGPHLNGFCNGAGLAEPIHLSGRRLAMGIPNLYIATEDLPGIPLNPRHHRRGNGANPRHRRDTKGQTGEEYAEGRSSAA